MLKTYISTAAMVLGMAVATAPAQQSPVVPAPQRPPGADAPGSYAPPAAAPRPPQQHVLRLQVELDRQGFSAGSIDGRWGSQTAEALKAWQRRQGLRVTGEWNADVSNRFAAVTNHIAMHIVMPEDLADLGRIPDTWPEKAALPAMGYETLQEKLAERYHARPSLLEQLNPKLRWPNPPVGSLVYVPNADTTRERLPKASRLEVNLDRKFIEAFDGQGRLIAHFPCSIAQKVEKRPRGETTVVTAAMNPNYTFDPALFAEDPVASAIPTKLIIPPGPNNPVGAAWVSLALPGYGMHGTPRPEDIGRTESHGCFRLHNWNAVRLAKMVLAGIPVTMIHAGP